MVWAYFLAQDILITFKWHIQNAEFLWPKLWATRSCVVESLFKLVNEKCSCWPEADDVVRCQAVDSSKNKGINYTKASEDV